MPVLQCGRKINEQRFERQLKWRRRTLACSRRSSAAAHNKHYTVSIRKSQGQSFRSFVGSWRNRSRLDL